MDEKELKPATSCEHYKDGFCKVTGAPCPHYESTYKECKTRIRVKALPSGSIMTLKDESASFKSALSTVCESIRWEPYGSPWMEDIWVRENEQGDFVDAITQTHIRKFEEIRENPTQEDLAKFAETIAEYIRYRKNLGKEPEEEASLTSKSTRGIPQEVLRTLGREG